MSNEMSFNKRIVMVKKAVFEGVINSKELDSIAGSKKTGYYSMNTIFTFLYPALEKYDIDLDLLINCGSVTGIWYDCLSDKERVNTVNFSELKEKLQDVRKLPMMANEVQSDGAIKSYIRRYALTNILGLNATDIIENNSSSSSNYNSSSSSSSSSKKQYTTQIPGQNKTAVVTEIVTETKTDKKISQLQLKRLFAIMSQAGQTEISINTFIKKKFNLDSKKDLNNEQYKYVCDRLEMSIQKDVTGDELPVTTPTHAQSAQPVK